MRCLPHVALTFMAFAYSEGAHCLISVIVNITTVAAVDTAIKNVDTGQGTPAQVTGKIGQSVKDGSFTFVVHSVKCGLTTSGGSLPSKPQDEFCAVNLDSLFSTGTSVSVK